MFAAQVSACIGQVVDDLAHQRAELLASDCKESSRLSKRINLRAGKRMHLDAIRSCAVLAPELQNCGTDPAPHIRRTGSLKRTSITCQPTRAGVTRSKGFLRLASCRPNALHTNNSPALIGKFALSTVESTGPD